MKEFVVQRLAVPCCSPFPVPPNVDRAGSTGASTQFDYRAVYTGIKKPEFFSHSGFSLEVARQLPLNTATKKRIEKPTSEEWFFETPPVFHWFFANVNARSPLTCIIRVFGHMGRDLLRNHLRPATYCALHCMVTGREKLPMCTTYKKKTVWDSGVFRACAFLAKKKKSYGFFGSVNGTTTKPRFFGFWFLPM